MTNHDEPGAMLETLKITKTTNRPVGGTWAEGTIAGHAFEALVFPEHAADPAFELGTSRISKLSVTNLNTASEDACFDRGWRTTPTKATARAIVDLLAAGLAEMVFGK